MNHSPYILPSLLLIFASLTVRAQVPDDRRQHMPPDTLRSDFEEWLHNEPPQSAPHDSLTLRPLPPSMALAHPERLMPQHPKVSVVIMTPQLRTDMQLAYQSHWLAEQRKEQQNGAMMIGVNPLSLIGYALSKILPNRKSKKQREREKLQRVLDNY